jgi:hypothetical protein
MWNRRPSRRRKTKTDCWPADSVLGVHAGQNRSGERGLLHDVATGPGVTQLHVDGDVETAEQQHAD